jgi:fluoride ion exporter CrcB/FEX
MATCLAVLLFVVVGAGAGGLLRYGLGWLLVPLMKEQGMAVLVVPVLSAAAGGIGGAPIAVIWLLRR